MTNLKMELPLTEMGVSAGRIHWEEIYQRFSFLHFRLKLTFRQLLKVLNRLVHKLDTQE